MVVVYCDFYSINGVGVFGLVGVSEVYQGVVDGGGVVLFEDVVYQVVVGGFQFQFFVVEVDIDGVIYVVGMVFFQFVGEFGQGDFFYFVGV